MEIRFMWVVLFLCSFVFSGKATSPDPCVGVCDVFETIVANAKANPEVRNDALMLLALVVEGRAVEIPEAVEARVGLPPTDFLLSPYAYLPNRGSACRYIGKLATAEAVAYLENLSTGNFKEEARAEVWPQCQVALAEGRMLLIPSPDGRIRFLIEQLHAEPVMYSRGAVGHWSYNTLCDSGDRAALAPVTETIRKWWGNTRQSADDIAFCRQRIEVIASSPDRVQALASVLKQTPSDDNDRLFQWAIGSLANIGSKEAFEELDHFVARAAALRGGDPEGAELMRRRAHSVESLRSLRKTVKVQ